MALNFPTRSFEYDITAGLPLGYLAERTTDPKGNAVTRVKDKAGRPYQVKEGSTVTAAYTYYDNCRLMKLQYIGSSEEYTYYPNNRLHTLSNKKGGLIIEAFNYTYGPAGNMTIKFDGKGTTTYTYDELSRLLTVTEPGGKTTAYTYDQAGNRLTESVTAGGTVTTSTYTYNEQNRLLSVNKTMPGGSVETLQYTYDNNGNVISRISSVTGNGASGSQEVELRILGVDLPEPDALYEYDSRNRLVQVP